MMDLMQKAREIAAMEAEALWLAQEILAGHRDHLPSVQSAHIALQQGEKAIKALEPFVVTKSGDEFTTITVRSTAIDDARQALAEWEAGQ